MKCQSLSRDQPSEPPGSPAFLRKQPLLFRLGGGGGRRFKFGMCHSAAISWQLLDTTCEEDLVFPFLHHPCMTGRSQQRALWPYLQPPCCDLEKVSSVQSLSRVRLCDPMNRSTPGPPVRHQTPGVHPNPCPLCR